MKEKIISLINNYNPWHLRKKLDECNALVGKQISDHSITQFQLNSTSKDLKWAQERLKELEQKAVEYRESLDSLTEKRDDVLNECQQYVVKENERLRAEVDRLITANTNALAERDNLRVRISVRANELKALSRSFDALMTEWDENEAGDPQGRNTRYA